MTGKEFLNSDLADIMRLVETHPRLMALLPPAVRALLE